MKALTTTRSALPTLPDVALLPTFSRVLSDGIWLADAQRPPPPRAREEAVALLMTAAPMLGAPKAIQVENWLKRVNLGASQPIAPADFAVRAPIIVDALLSLPAGAFTVETARAAILQFKWFPGGAEVAEFLTPTVRSLRDFQYRLKIVANFVDPPPPRDPPTEQERQAVHEIVAGMTRRPKTYSAKAPERTVEEQIAFARGEK